MGTFKLHEIERELENTELSVTDIWIDKKDFKNPESFYDIIKEFGYNKEDCKNVKRIEIIALDIGNF